MMNNLMNSFLHLGVVEYACNDPIGAMYRVLVGGIALVVVMSIGMIIATRNDKLQKRNRAHLSAVFSLFVLFADYSSIILI